MLGRDNEQFVYFIRVIPLNGDVFVSDLFLWDLNVFYSFLWDVLRDVLSEIFHSVVVCNSDLFRNSLDFSLLSVLDFLHLLGHSLHFGLVLVFDDLLLEGHVLDSALPFYHFFACVHGSADYLGISGCDGGSCRGC